MAQLHNSRCYLTQPCDNPSLIIHYTTLHCTIYYTLHYFLMPAPRLGGAGAKGEASEAYQRASLVHITDQNSKTVKLTSHPSKIFFCIRLFNIMGNEVLLITGFTVFSLVVTMAWVGGYLDKYQQYVFLESLSILSQASKKCRQISFTPRTCDTNCQKKKNQSTSRHLPGQNRRKQGFLRSEEYVYIFLSNRDPPDCREHLLNHHLEQPHSLVKSPGMRTSMLCKTV